MNNVHHVLGMALISGRDGMRLGNLESVVACTTDNRIRYRCFKAADARADGALRREPVRGVGELASTVDLLEPPQTTVPASERDHLTCFVGDRTVVTNSGARLVDKDLRPGRGDRPY